jgi:uncharacterized membrane protein YjgN (DUF898 family)
MDISEGVPEPQNAAPVAAGAAILPQPLPALGAASVPPQRLSIRFIGDGREYFGIWIVNLLLTIVTVGIYYPWAKARRLRYFHSHTFAGGYPLGFHAKGIRMFFGYLVIGVLFALYQVMGRMSPLAGMAMLVVMLLLWPALLRSALCFRLGNTSWRGLRFQFRGTLGGAYMTYLLPILLPLVLLFAVVLAAAFVIGRYKHPAWSASMTTASAYQPAVVAGVVLVILTLVIVSLLIFPWAFQRLKKYQHDHYAYGGEQTRFRVGAGQFYLLFLKTFGTVFVLTMAMIGVFVVILAIAALVIGVINTVNKQPIISGDARHQAQIVGVVVIGVWAVFWLAVRFLLRSYFIVRSQNLVWSNTASTSVRFVSTLDFRSLFWLTVKNFLLNLVTLGFYWPFAAVAMYRLRVQSIVVEVLGGLGQFTDAGHKDANDATGLAAGDFFGFDIGL